MQHNLFFPLISPIIPLLLYCEPSSVLVTSSHSSTLSCTASPVGNIYLTFEQLYPVPQHMPSYICSVKHFVIARSSGHWRWIILCFFLLTKKRSIKTHAPKCCTALVNIHLQLHWMLRNSTNLIFIQDRPHVLEDTAHITWITCKICVCEINFKKGQRKRTNRMSSVLL